jgi:hypothetical protein
MDKLLTLPDLLREYATAGIRKRPIARQPATQREFPGFDLICITSRDSFKALTFCVCATKI